MSRTAASPEAIDDPFRFVDVLAFGLTVFSFFAAGTFLVVVVLVFVAVAFFGAAAFLGLASDVFCNNVRGLILCDGI